MEDKRKLLRHEIDLMAHVQYDGSIPEVQIVCPRLTSATFSDDVAKKGNLAEPALAYCYQDRHVRSWACTFQDPPVLYVMAAILRWCADLIHGLIRVGPPDQMTLDRVH
jgi:hypothetical protein